MNLTIALGLSGLIAVSGPVLASEDRNLALDNVEVIGSRAQSGTAVDSAVPVDIFTGEDLRAAGAMGNELGEALALVAPSFNFPRQSNSVTSDHVRAAQLRGMNPDQVLVLVNGKRRHVSAVVNDNTKIGRGTNAFDFNTIPLSAVRRVEILRDGASAQYGSDAIAGVINIVLDDDTEGLAAGGQYGLHHTRVDPIEQTVTDGQTVNAWLRHGLALGSGGFFNYGVEATTRSATNRAGFDRVSPFIPQTDANLAFVGTRTHRVGDPDSETLGLWFNSEKPAGELVFYASGTAAFRDTEGAAVYRYPDSNQNVRELFPEGFRPVTRGDNLDIGLSVGARHDRGAWMLDHSVSFGHNRFEFGVDNSLNPSLGPDSPTRFNSGTFRFTQASANSEARRTYDHALFGNDLHVATGLDYRYERFESRPGDPASYTAGDFEYPPELAALVGFPDIGAQGAKGLSPADAADDERHVVGVFTEMSGDLGERFEATVAGRFEHYDDFGSTLTGKLAGRYRIGDETALRASLSNSFRAPSLSQASWARRDNTFSAEGARIASRLINASSTIARELGIESLDEETAVNFSAGVVWNAAGGASLSLDVFEIRVDDRITLSEFIRDPAIIDFVQTLPGGEGVQAIAAFSNSVDTRTRGVEAVAGYRIDTDHGFWRFDSAYTWARTRIRNIAEIPEAMTTLSPDVALVGVEQRNTIETATPEHQWITSVRWQGRRWHANSRLRAYSSVVREFTFARQRFGAQYALDFEAGYALANNWNVVAGASNLTDQYPDPSGEANDFFGNFAYDPINPVGLNGRFVYLRSNWQF